jgi:dienelactone hydrolase
MCVQRTNGGPSPNPARVRWLSRGLVTLATLALLTAATARAGAPAEGPGRPQGPRAPADPVSEVDVLASFALLGLLAAHIVGAARSAETAPNQRPAVTPAPRESQDPAPGPAAPLGVTSVRSRAGAAVPGSFRSKRLCDLGLAALTMVALCGTSAAAEPAGEAKPACKHFTSGGKKIPVECFLPGGGGKHPVLVVLHAVEGPDGALQRMYQTKAREYATRGYVVLLVHYFHRTGMEKKDVEGYVDLFLHYFHRKEHKAADVKRMKALTAEWGEVVRDAVDFARTVDGVDRERVGLVGFSLGATLAMTAATKYDLKLAALVECFGTLPKEARAGLAKLPATLVIHGEDDQIIPVEEAYCLIGLLTLRQVKYEVEVYSAADHMFFRDRKDVQWEPLLKANRRVGAFLDTHLKP